MTKIEIPVNCTDPLHDNSQECYNFVFSIQQNFMGFVYYHSRSRGKISIEDRG